MEQNKIGLWINLALAALLILGIGMTVYAVLLGILGIISVILVFTLKSPKTVKKEMKTLEGSALSGKRIKKSQSAGDIMRQRRNPTIANPSLKKKKRCLIKLKA